MRSGKAEETPEVKMRRVDEPPYTVDRSKLDRFDSKNIVFDRIIWDSSWKGYQRFYDENVFDIIAEGKPGYSRADFALAYASWTVHDAFEGGFSRKKIATYRNPQGTIGIDWTKVKKEGTNPTLMTALVKRAARLFGAALVGVAKLDRNWLYADDDVPDSIENAFVLAIEMDSDGIATSPAAPAAATTGVGYSKIVFVLSGVGEFIRNLGYTALQCGNYTGLSIPLAIDAGLGELGRNGLLITPQHGPRVRICKIFTDLPLEPDKPIEFGVKEFCKRCKRCAAECEVDAISTSDEPSFEVACRSNNPGALKWYVDFERCYLYWCENGIDCSTCIKVCPYNAATAENVQLSPKEFWKSNGQT